MRNIILKIGLVLLGFLVLSACAPRVFDMPRHDWEHISIEEQQAVMIDYYGVHGPAMNTNRVLDVRPYVHSLVGPRVGTHQERQYLAGLAKNFEAIHRQIYKGTHLGRDPTVRDLELNGNDKKKNHKHKKHKKHHHKKIHSKVKKIKVHEMKPKPESKPEPEEKAPDQNNQDKNGNGKKIYQQVKKRHHHRHHSRKAS